MAALLEQETGVVRQRFSGFAGTKDIRAAIEANWVDYHSFLGRSTAAEWCVGPYFSWLMTNLPDHFTNLVVCTRLPSERADDLIEGAMSHFKSMNIGKLSWLTQDDVASDRISGALLARGLTFKESFATEMAVNLWALPEAVALPRGLTIKRVADATSLAQWVHVASTGFGIAPEFERYWFELCVDRILDAQFPTFLALLDGEPVGTSQLFPSAGVAGIYNVTCMPDARGRGIGSAVTLTALLEAREMGYQVGTLQASRRGYPVYKRLGFQDLGPLSVFLWEDDLVS
jgi:GNAT superfamily N-acetyltransferase